jgi:ABC-type methionine transport system permease subunit
MENYILIILVFSVLAVLMAGVVLMGSGGELNKKYGNKLMVARVSLQWMIVLLLILVYVFHKS